MTSRVPLQSPELPPAAVAIMRAGQAPIALVIGMSIHGLAIARALSRAGITVHALEQRGDAPAVRTRYAQVHVADGVNSDRLVKLLLDLRPKLQSDRPVVLFPSSDNIVRAIANSWELLAPHYALSWHHCRDQVLKLQSKDNIGLLAERQHMTYPKSYFLTEEAGIRRIGAAGEYPLLVKPVKPLSSFKAIKVNDDAELAAVHHNYHADLPFVVQHWIDGDETRLHFCTMYLHEGRVLAHFTGRKLRSQPRATGMGSVVESYDNPEVLRLSYQLVEGLGLSGPIAIEYKQDAGGTYWLIEPNVGRTEYSVDLLIQHGINLPLIEYWATQGIVITPDYAKLRPVIWFDTERDGRSYLLLCLRSGSLCPYGKTPIFPYLGHDDTGPFRYALGARLLQPIRGAAHRLRRLFERHSPVRLHRCGSIMDLPPDARRFLEGFEQKSLFFSYRWFENYEREVGRLIGTPEWYCVRDLDGRLLGVWPFVRSVLDGAVVLEGMGNYYTPYFTLPYAAEKPGDLELLASALLQIVHGADYVTVGPIAPEDPLFDLLANDVAPPTLMCTEEYNTTNWFQQIASLEDYYATREGRLKTILQRKGKRLARDGKLEFKLFTDKNGLEAATDEYFKIYDSSWKSSEPYPGLIRHLIQLAASAGWLRLGILYVDERPVAAQLWFVQNATAFIYKLAYDEQFSSFSVGTLLTRRMIDHVVANDGVSKLDYLTGDDTYKRSWMDSNRILKTLFFINVLRPQGALFYLKQRLGALLDRFRRRQPQVPG